MSEGRNTELVSELRERIAAASDHERRYEQAPLAFADAEALLDALESTSRALSEKEGEMAGARRERDDLVAMSGGGLRSLAIMMKATFAGRGVEITDVEAEKAAARATELIIHAALAGNPREWCLSCGTVSGDGQCHCTEPFAAAACNRKARNHVDEMASEANAVTRQRDEALAALKASEERETAAIEAGRDLLSYLALYDFKDRDPGEELPEHMGMLTTALFARSLVLADATKKDPGTEQREAGV